MSRPTWPTPPPRPLAALMRSALFPMHDDARPVDAHGDVFRLEPRHRRGEHDAPFGLVHAHRKDLVARHGSRHTTPGVVQFKADARREAPRKRRRYVLYGRHVSPRAPGSSQIYKVALDRLATKLTQQGVPQDR